MTTPRRLYEQTRPVYCHIFPLVFVVFLVGLLTTIDEDGLINIAGTSSNPSLWGRKSSTTNSDGEKSIHWTLKNNGSDAVDPTSKRPATTEPTTALQPSSNSPSVSPTGIATSSISPSTNPTNAPSSINPSSSPSDSPTVANQGVTMKVLSSHVSIRTNPTTPSPTPDVASLMESLSVNLHPTPTKVKLTAQGQIDWSQYDHILLYHTRKAGGTSLYQWGKLVAERHNLTFSQLEGTTYDPIDWTVDNPGNYDHKRVFVFTSLRPPVERVLSSYWFDIFQLLKNKKNETMTIEEFFHETNNVNNGIRNQPISATGTHTPLHGSDRSQFSVEHQYETAYNINNDEQQHDHTEEGVVRGWVWLCATNCYSKWFGGWPNKDKVPDTLNAVKVLDEMEIIWTDSLHSDDYQEWILQRWNVTDIPIRHANKEGHHSNNRGNFTAEEMALLQTSNQPDIGLYEPLRHKWSHYTNMTLK